MQTFKINNKLEVVCESQNTRYGFRHLATLLYNGYERNTAKCCYYNRTWEKYEFESVLENLLEKCGKNLSGWDKRCFKALIKNGGKHSTDNLKTIGMIASLGNIFANTQKAKNDWKKRILKAGLETKGLIMPDNWDSLDENTKEVRLNGAIAQLK